MSPRKIFSIPLNFKMNEQEFTFFYEFCERNKDWIADIYFTSRMAPFTQDAMGDVFRIENESQITIEAALNIQKHLGIPVSATFNNIQVPPTQTNLDTFIINFKKLYDAGVHIATIPHTHWMATGQIQRAFPKLFIKNTILRDVRTATEIVALAQVGYDYINLDRDLMRDKDTLLRLKQAKEYIKETMGKDIQFSLLANEGCLGSCPMMVEHFEYNNNRTPEQPQYFNDPISRVSCPKWDVQDPAVALKTANFSPWKSDWDEYFDLGIDVFKMHGRESMQRLVETMNLIERYVDDEEILDPTFIKWIDETGLTGRPINIWREKIKNCKFDCWECQYCDKVYDKKTDVGHSDLVKFTAECIAESGVPTVYNNIPGLTSPRVQTLLNLLAKGVGSYLEIGSALGATACAALKNNPLNAYFVDNWKNNIQPQRNDMSLPANTKTEFEKNVQQYKGASNITVFDSDMFEVNTLPLNESIQLFFYDGPHDLQSTKNAVLYYYSTFAKEAILVFDDANWDGVVNGAVMGVQESGGQIVYEKLMLNSEENKREWWNGLYIMVIRK
jgi:predicted O-methyltransferase YrrM